MTKMILDFDFTLCSSCGACAIACMDQNDFDIKIGTSPFRTTFEIESFSKNSNLPHFSHYSVACMHCSPAPCIKGCPTGCLSKDPDTDLTIYNNTHCIGCHSCSMACPFGAPSFNQDGKMQKCDGCFARINYGMDPACVHTCPTGALKMVTLEEYEHNHSEGSIRPRTKEIAQRQV